MSYISPTTKAQPLPHEFLNRLRSIIPEQNLARVIDTFSSPEQLAVRINTLKAEPHEVELLLQEQGVAWERFPAVPEARILSDVTEQRSGITALFSQGILYRQNISSMLPVEVLSPQPGERILDACAAPGGKTSHIAALMRNEGTVVAVEAIRGRYYKLKSVLSLMGAENVSCFLMDARRFRARDELFDRILVDAPCTCEGGFKTFHPQTFAYWSKRKIREMVRKQRGILLSASRALKEGGALVYATCTFSPEENEGVVNWLLEKTKGAMNIEEVHLPGVETYPAVAIWEGKEFSPQVKRCLRILPDGKLEGFFLAKLKRGLTPF
jgi:16S rRNA (cytosine1407-C5)-methyltransferase